MKLLALIPLAFLFSCSSLDIVGDAVTKYCELSEAQRNANKEAVTKSVAPNMIEITCEQETNTEGV